VQTRKGRFVPVRPGDRFRPLRQKLEAEWKGTPPSFLPDEIGSLPGKKLRVAHVLGGYDKRESAKEYIW
jgi:hypothetical protein